MTEARFYHFRCSDKEGEKEGTKEVAIKKDICQKHCRPSKQLFLAKMKK